MISVIVPVYNAEKFLERTVESICAQTYRNLEILLVDDGSADGSLALCESMARCDSRIRVFHKENGGASSARNLGVREARGGYVGFVDSDDLIAPEMYERLARGAAAAEGGMLSGMVSEAGVGDQIQSGTVSEAGAGGCIPSGGAKPWGQELTDRGRTDPRSAVLVQIGRDEQDEQGRPLPPALLPPEREMLIPSEAFMESLLLYTGDSSFCTKLTPRALLLEHPFPEGVMGEDFLLHMKLLPEIGGVLCLPDTGYHVVHRAGSVTRRLDASQFSRSYIDIVRHADYVEEEVCVRYPSLQRQARRFGLYERLDYLLHVPVSDMTGSNAFYRGVIGYLRRHVADTLRSPYLDRKSRLYLLLFTIAPRTLRRAHKALRRL
ncbi:MAG: glycosyltransferase family A protein [Eubacteriales bacterium]|nr:glycosyltransferase family A protein [Eubacteriales bacterium]